MMYPNIARLGLLAFAAFCLAACATTADDEPLTGGLFGPAMPPAAMQKAIEAAAAFPLGSDKNPVRVDMPAGERGYLARLRCSNSQPPQFDRSGSVGTGPFGNILDLYNVRCPGGAPAESQVYMDMYFGDYIENRPVPGFTITTP